METCGFTNNPDFILLKWRLKTKHLPAKCVIRAIEIHQMEICLNPLTVNPTQWSNTLKQFVDKLPTNCLSVFDNFVGLVLKGLIQN